jgi:hypothetical protein
MKVFIPSPREQVAVFCYELTKPTQLGRRETFRIHQLWGLLKPPLRMAIAFFNVDMWSFKSFIAKEEKPEAVDDENGRHDAPIALWHQATNSTLRFAVQVSSQSDHSVLFVSIETP